MSSEALDMIDSVTRQVMKEWKITDKVLQNQSTFELNGIEYAIVPVNLIELKDTILREVYSRLYNKLTKEPDKKC